MEEFKDYEVFIEDLEVPEKDLTKAELIEIINERIKKQWKNKTGEIEIDIKPEWKELLQKDGSIFWDYEKLGWKVMWYNQKYSTKPTRSWLSFKNLKNKANKKWKRK